MSPSCSVTAFGAPIPSAGMPWRAHNIRARDIASGLARFPARILDVAVFYSHAQRAVLAAGLVSPDLKRAALLWEAAIVYAEHLDAAASRPLIYQALACPYPNTEGRRKIEAAFRCVESGEITWLTGADAVTTYPRKITAWPWQKALDEWDRAFNLSLGA